jgi:hypothetical protein
MSSDISFNPNRRLPCQAPVIQIKGRGLYAPVLLLANAFFIEFLK